MLIMFTRVSWIMPLIVAAISAASHAAEKPLNAVSAEAGFVVRIKAPKSTIAKASAYAEEVAAGYGEHVRTFVKSCGELILNPKFAGVDMESDWWLAGYPVADDLQFDLVFVIPATDKKAMREALGDGVRFFEMGKFAVYTTSRTAAETTATRLRGQGRAISMLIDLESNAVLESGDVSGFMNVRGLVAGRRQWFVNGRKWLDETREAAQMPLWLPPEMTFGVICHWFLETIAQRVEDIRDCAVAAKIADDGVNLESVVSIEFPSAIAVRLVGASGPQHWLHGRNRGNVEAVQAGPFDAWTGNRDSHLARYR
jgi:hypothetical protein